MLSTDTRKLFGVFAEAGGNTRFIGGCVRDAIQGRKPVSDIDLATDLLPQQVTALLETAGIRFVTPGLTHGTVTAIPDQRKFEITTLREDIDTDGRRASVAFTRDWSRDAARRDFTINALSATLDGTVYDYVGGLDDLAAGRVRFIGKALDRIAEDHLRILRYFRFHAWYGKTAPDTEAMEACAACTERVQSLPGERIWAELSRILAAPTTQDTLTLMEATGVLANLVPAAIDIQGVRALESLETSLAFQTSPLLRLTALLPKDSASTARVANRLRLSQRDTSVLSTLVSRRGDPVAFATMTSARRLLYTLGPELFRDLVVLEWSAAPRTSEKWANFLDMANSWAPPAFPVTGDDVVATGIPRGPEIGRILRRLEDWWIDEAFAPDRDACIERLMWEVGTERSTRPAGTGHPL